MQKKHSNALKVERFCERDVESAPKKERHQSEMRLITIDPNPATRAKKKFLNFIASLIQSQCGPPKGKFTQECTPKCISCAIRA